MVVQVVLWACSICRREYASEDAAIRCEARGEFRGIILPGTILEDCDAGGHFRLMVADSPFPVYNEDAVERHYAVVRAWFYFDRQDGAPSEEKDHYPISDYPRLGVGPYFVIQGFGGGPSILMDDAVLNGLPEDQILTLKLDVHVDTTTARYRRAWDSHSVMGRKLYMWSGGRSVEAPPPTWPCVTTGIPKGRS